MSKEFKVTYKGTKASDKYGTLKAARAQAKYALKVGNTRSCIARRNPSGTYRVIECYTRAGGGKPRRMKRLHHRLHT